MNEKSDEKRVGIDDLGKDKNNIIIAGLKNESNSSSPQQWQDETIQKKNTEEIDNLYWSIAAFCFLIFIFYFALFIFYLLRLTKDKEILEQALWPVTVGLLGFLGLGFFLIFTIISIMKIQKDE